MGNAEDRDQPSSDAPIPRPRRRQGRPLANDSRVGREEIMRAARELMLTVRPSKLTKTMVCSKAGTDPTLLTYHFGSLDNLLVEILKSMIQELNERIAASNVKRASPTVRLKRRFETLTDFVLDHPGFFDLLVTNVYYGESEWSRQALVDLTKPAYESISRIVGKGREINEFKPDFDERMLYAIIIGLTEFVSAGQPVFAILFPGKSPEAIVRLFKRSAFNMILHGIADPDQDENDND